MNLESHALQDSIISIIWIYLFWKIISKVAFSKLRMKRDIKVVQEHENLEGWKTARNVVQRRLAKANNIFIFQRKRISGWIPKVCTIIPSDKYWSFLMTSWKRDVKWNVTKEDLEITLGTQKFFNSRKRVLDRRYNLFSWYDKFYKWKDIFTHE